MNFISYAQNFEDVMLWRALKHVENGFYIDVGANDPTVDSVTKIFYERGWHGINIEPLPSHHADLSKERPRDINLQCAAGAESGELVLWECDVRGWATASQEVVAQHMADGHDGMFHKVPVRRLAEICEEFVSDDIHFLKVDVEGFEESVIRGMDFSRFRPWILVIEATKPNSTMEEHKKWESLVFDARYVLAYCDGLNRFYVAKEHPELLGALRYPPNVFDSFARSEHVRAELRAQQAETKAQQLESRAATVEAEARAAMDKAHTAAAEAEARALQSETLRLSAELRAQQAETKAQQAEAHATQLQTELDAVHAANHHHWQLAEARHQEIQGLLNSTSWRITAPMRWVANMTYRLFKLPQTVQLMTKEKIKLILEHAKLYINRRPMFKKAILDSPSLRFIAKWAIGHYPRLKPIVRNLMEIESPRLNPRSFDNLAAIRIMSAMSESHINTTNTDPVIFLQVPHEQ